MKKLTILGSTGSIGTQTLEITENNPQCFSIGGLTANNNWKLLAEQTKKFNPGAIAIGNPHHLPALKNELKGTKTEILSGSEGINHVAAVDSDLVVVALVGISGLIPTLTAIETGKTIALANKETLVVGGELVMASAARNGVSIIPIDSEHSAVFQCMNGESAHSIRRIILTSSGGPFRNTPVSELPAKTAGDALKHPNWDMGKKVTIDSSTLMNKGFEVIEARWLFYLEPEQIKVIIHPQSVIHSMVEFLDGSILAQLSLPDMRIPIQYALTYPERISGNFVKTDFVKLGSLTFEEPRVRDFPCLSYAFEALEKGGTMPAVLNGANEIAVGLFLENYIGFTDIARVIRETMDKHVPVADPNLKNLLEADSFARKTAMDLAGSKAGHR